MTMGNWQRQIAWLLKTLIRQSLPEVQLKFIAVLERSPMLQTQISNQVSIS